MFYFDKLPLEVIANIYKYLDVKDIKVAELTCHQWLNASQLHEFEDRTILKLTSLNDSVQELFKNSFRKFLNVHFIFVNNYKPEKELVEFLSLTNIGGNIKCLILENFKYILFETLYKILKLLPNLSVLICIETTFVNNAKGFPKNKMEIIKISEIISNTISTKMESLKFFGDKLNPYLYFKIFSRLKNLKKINFSNIFSENLSKLYLYQIIKNNEKSLKSLSLIISTNKTSFLNSLLLLSNLNLQTFSLKFNASWPGIRDFFKSHSLITVLRLQSSKLNDQDMTVILRNLPVLESLNLENSQNLTSSTLLEIGKVKSLKSLNINNLYRIRSDGIINGLVKELNNKMIDFRCLNVPLTDEAYIKIAENLPNLKILHCGSQTLSDISIQAIISNCKNIIDLNIFSSDKITDYGLTGINLKTKEKTGYCLSDLDKLVCLNIRKCSKITDQTLFYGLKFQNLKTLYLPACFPYFSYLPWLKIRKASLNGFKTFTKNCPSIKELNLLGCSGTENLDTIIQIVMENLSGLERMTIVRHCERVLINQEAFLIKNRKDLSRIQIDCNCEVCVNIKELCKQFLS